MDTIAIYDDDYEAMQQIFVAFFARHNVRVVLHNDQSYYVIDIVDRVITYRAIGVVIKTHNARKIDIARAIFYLHTLHPFPIRKQSILRKIAAFFAAIY